MIVLRRLRVAALKQLRDIDMRFPERGSVLIEGSNEAGKSTVFEAIYFALYGAALVGEDAHANLAALTPHGATDADAALSFQIGETELEVRRTLTTTRRQMHDAALTVRRPGAAPEQLHGPRAVNDRILQELGGLDGEALRNSCLMEQQALDRIESLSRTDREGAIANLLGLKRLIAIEAELKVTAEERAQVTHLRERLRLARAVATRRRDADAAQRAADALALQLRVAETRALIADRDADAAHRRDATQRAAQLADEIAQLEARIAQAQRIGALARRLDDAASREREATEASNALAQTDARLATLAHSARDELPQAERRLDALRVREAALADALRARDAALSALRAAQAEMRQGQALAESRQQRALALDRLTEAAASADAAYQRAHVALAEAERAADAARQAEAQAQHTTDLHLTARDTLARWVSAQAAADSHASAAAAAQAGAQDASEMATRLNQRREATAAQLALARRHTRQARTPALVAGLLALGALLVAGAALAGQQALVAGLAALIALLALGVCVALGMRWRAAVAAVRAASADHQTADRAAYEATARRDALLVALRDTALRSANAPLVNPTDGAATIPDTLITPDAPTSARPASEATTLAAALQTVGLATPTTLVTGRATLATLDAQVAALQGTLRAAQAASHAAELQMARAQAAAEAAQRQCNAAQQAASAANSANDAPAATDIDTANANTRGAKPTPAPGALASATYANAEPLAPLAILTARLAQAEQTYAAAEAALDALGAPPTSAASGDLAPADAPDAHTSLDARDPTALAAQRGEAQALVTRLHMEQSERASLSAQRNDQAQRAHAALEALRAALITSQREADALALHSTAPVQAGQQVSNESEMQTTPMILTPLIAWRSQLATAVGVALSAYDVAQLHAHLGASRAERDALATQLADQDAQSTRIEHIRATLAEQGVACLGDEPLAILATHWPALADSAESREHPTPTTTPQSVALPLGEGQPRAVGDAAGWGRVLRRDYEQARRQADEARGAATQATALLHDHAGVANAPTDGVTPNGVTPNAVTPNGVTGAGLDEDACQAQLADAERALRRRELAAQMARDVRARIARRVLPETEAYMRALLPELTAGRYRDVELLREDAAGQGARGAGGGADLRIRVWDQLAGRYVAKGLFSGGARDQVSLALRLAFALATLPKELGAMPGFIFLDEPLSAFDAERSAALERLLTRGVIARQFPQVFLISHSQSLDPAHFDYRVRMAAGRIVETNLPDA